MSTSQTCEGLSPCNQETFVYVNYGKQNLTALIINFFSIARGGKIQIHKFLVGINVLTSWIILQLY